MPRRLALVALLLLTSSPASADDATEQRLRALEAHVFGGIQVSGFVHADWVVHRESSVDQLTPDGQPLNEDRFLLRRARLRGERDGGYFHGVVELDANTVQGIQVRPVEAAASFKWPANRPYARTPWAIDPSGSAKPISSDDTTQTSATELTTYDAPWFMVTAGLFRTPFGFEVQEAERQRPFLERATMSNALFPQSFDLGLRVVGGYRVARWSLGIMNGEPIGSRTFPGRDPNKSKDMVFRVGAASALVDWLKIEGGVSGLTGRGFHQGLPATADQIQWQDANNDRSVNNVGEITVIPGQPSTPSQTFKRFAVGADLRASVAIPVLGALDLRAELVRGSNLDRGLLVSDPIAAARDLRQSGFYLGLSQELTRYGLIGVRWDKYDPDADAREQEPFRVVLRDAVIETWSFSATGRLGLGRLVAQYDHRTNTQGRDANGRPTTLADDSFTLRAEVRF